MAQNYDSRTVTQTNTSSCQCPPYYIRTVPGILKIVEMVRTLFDNRIVLTRITMSRLMCNIIDIYILTLVRSFVWLPVRKSVSPSVRHPSVCPPVRPSSVRPFVRPSVRPSVGPSVRPSVRPYVQKYMLL